MEIGYKVKVKNPNTKAEGEMLSEKTVKLLEILNHTGVVTQIKDELYYVGFAHESLGWVTQVFKAEEIEVVK